MPIKRTVVSKKAAVMAAIRIYNAVFFFLFLIYLT